MKKETLGDEALWSMPYTPLDNFEAGMDRPMSASGWKSLGGKWLNLGAGNKQISGAVPVDLPRWDADRDQLPYDAESVSGIIAYHFLEHVESPMKVLIECQRVLRVGGVMNIVVPYGMEDCWLQDLSHKHAFIEDTWKNLFDNPYYSRDFDRWKFVVNFNMIMGLNRRNLVLVTQLEKV